MYMNIPWWEKDITSISDAVSILREARKFNRDSILYLSRALQVNRYTISRWEQGITYPRLDTYQQKFLVEYVKSVQAKRRRVEEYLASCLS